MTTPDRSTRRDRRAAELAARRSRSRVPVGGPSDTRRRLGSPMLILSAGAVILGIVAVIGLAVLSRPAGPTGPDGTVLTPGIAPVPSGLVDGRSVGAAGAPVTIEVWSDFQCPVCGHFTDLIEMPLRTTYITDGTVRLTYRDMAFLGPESTDAAIAARVSEAMGPGFWAFHDILFANQSGENEGAFSRQRLADMAASLGMDRGAFLTALDDPSYASAVRAETSAGAAQGIDSTPTLIINGTTYNGLPKWADLAALIDRLAASG